MKLTFLSPLALGLAAGCASSPTAKEPAPAAKAAHARVASGRPELRYYEISDV
jgi:hypothetical protein